MKNKKSWEHITIHCLIWIIIGLIGFMLVMVTFDRCSFHTHVYRTASSGVNILEKQMNGYPDSLLIDSCVKNISQFGTKIESQKSNLSLDAKNLNEKHKKEAVNSDSNIINQKLEEISFLFNFLKDVDGLISSNGLTFLVSFMVALLIALLTSRIRKMEELLDNYRGIKEKMESLYKHSAIYNLIFTRIKSIYNLAILISNVTMSLPHPSHCYVHLNCIGDIDVKCSDLKSNEDKNNNALHIGSLCSRLSRLCDPIRDILNDRGKRLDYLTEDEKNILYTYFEDTIEELDRSLTNVKDNPFLYEIIKGKLELVEDIRLIIETIEIKKQEEK